MFFHLEIPTFVSVINTGGIWLPVVSLDVAVVWTLTSKSS